MVSLAVLAKEVMVIDEEVAAVKFAEAVEFACGLVQFVEGRGLCAVLDDPRGGCC